MRSRSSRIHFHWCHLVCGVVAILLAMPLAAHAQLITSVTDSGGAVGPVPNGGVYSSQRENDVAGVIVPFGQEAFAYTDRNHRWKGPVFSSTTGALTLSNVALASGYYAAAIPSYLTVPGNEYVTVRNDNKGAANFRLNVTVGQNVTAYLLIDNRTGDGTGANPPVLGPAIAPWVAADGWVRMNRGFSPNGPNGPQPDYVGVDEGSGTLTTANFNNRATDMTNLITGPGNSVQNAATIYRKDFSAGETIILKQCDSIVGNNYGLVVTPRAECDLAIPSETTAVGLPDGTSPPPKVHTIKNVGTNNAPVAWTVEEWNPIANVATDYDWLTLDKTGGTIAGSSSDTLTLSFDATGLPIARHTGYLKFTDGCGHTTLHTVTFAIGAISDVSIIDSDGAPGGVGPTAQRENDWGGGAVTFKDSLPGLTTATFAFIDRNHAYVGPRFDPSTGLLVSNSNATGLITPGIPPYLVGGEYVSTLNTNRDNGTNFRLNVTVASDVAAYLLIDNRVGEATQVFADPPKLGAGGNTNMQWVIDDGWLQVDTGLSPSLVSDGSRQPDYVGLDGGSTPSNINTRSTGGLDSGRAPNDFFTVYKKTFVAGSTIVLRQQNDSSGSATNDNMYGLVVVPSVPCRLAVDPVQTNTVGSLHYPSVPSAKITITNTGSAGNPTSYTVTELNQQKKAADVEWLSVDKYQSDQPIAGGATDTLTVSFKPTGLSQGDLSQGTYVAYLRITDSCSPAKTLLHKVTLTIGQPPIITSVTDENSAAAITNGVTSQRENDHGYAGLGGRIVYFNEDVPAYTDRTHEYNGARFTSAGALATATATGDIVIGLPPYLIGGEYVSTLNNNKNSLSFLLHVTVDPPVSAYLLIDNRAGDDNNANPPNLGRNGTGNMPWVYDDGWIQMNTGISPNGQPDFGAYDEGGTPADFDGRVSGTGTGGAGNGLNNFFCVYKKNFPAGATITLKSPVANIGDMYGLVVTPRPDCGLTISKASSASALEGGTNPASIGVPVINDGTRAEPTGYTVVESDADGNALDYPWLSLDKLSGSIATELADVVTISFKITGAEFPGGKLAQGFHTGYLRFTNDCPSPQTTIHKITLEIQPPDLRLLQRLAPNGMYVQAVTNPDGTGMTWDEARVHYNANFKGNLPTFHGVTGDWTPPANQYVGVAIGSRADMWLPGTDADGVSSLDGVNLGALLGTSEGTFKWLDGTAVPTGDILSGGPWNTGEPNDANGSEDGMEIYASGAWNDDGTGPTLGAQVATVQPYYLLYQNVDLSGQGKFKVSFRPGTTASLAEAITLLKGPAVAGDAKGRYYAISMGDPGTGGGGTGAAGGWRDWPKVPWPVDDPVVSYVEHDNFVTRSIGVLVIPEAGPYTFVVAHDDDCQFTIGSQAEIGGACDSAGPLCFQTQLTGATVNSVLVTFPEAGEYPIELIQREGTGGSYLQLFAAKGDETASFSRGYRQIFRLVGDVLGGGLAVKTSVDVCGAVFADVDNDGDVDQADFGQFQACYSGAGFAVAAECSCFDRDGENVAGDGDIDAMDLQAFLNCYTGPSIQWSQAIAPNCVPERP